MLRPQFYPHPTDGIIRLLQTHISYLLLTGDYAYKVKKSVKPGAGGTFASKSCG